MSSLIVRSLSKAFPEGTTTRTILSQVDLEASPGQSIAILGPSGSGKSTLLNLIGALDKPDTGSITLGDIEVTKLKGNELSKYRNTRVGFVFQDHHLLPQCTAFENVLLPTLSKKATPADTEWAEALLAKVGLTNRQNAFPGKMSGGERQRVAVARALVKKPGVLLCDEPTGNLDAQNGKDLVDLLLDIQSVHATIIIMVTHNPGLAQKLQIKLELSQGKLQNKK